MAFSSRITKARNLWADMDDVSDSEFGFSTLKAPEMSSIDIRGNESDETSSLRTSDLSPLDCSFADSDDDPVQEARLEQAAAELNDLWQVFKCQKHVLAITPDKNPPLLATTPIKLPGLHLLHLSTSLLINGCPRQDNDQNFAPVAGFSRVPKVSNRPITLEELGRSKMKPGVGDVAAQMKPWSNPINRLGCNSNLDACTYVGPDRCPQPFTIDEPSNQHKRANKPSKCRRDRYKALVEQFQQQIDADPTMEIASMLPYLPSFVTSNSKLVEKLQARLQHYRQEKQQR